MSTFEVVKSPVDGWDVRRVGEPQALSNYPNRELAEQAAEKQQALEHEVGDADAIDVRGDVVSESPEEEVTAKMTFMGFGIHLVAIFALIVIVALIVSLTQFGS